MPLQRRERDARRAVRSDGGRGPDRIVERPPRRRRRWLGWTWRRWTLVTILGLLVLFVIWGALGYLSVSSGVGDANRRLPQSVRPVLAPDSGLLLSSPTTILLLGTDHATGKGSTGRSVDEHSDSITLLRTDPAHHRLYYLSVPRDLQTDVPGHGEQKINAAMQFGGPKLAVQTLDKLLARGCRSTTW